MYQKLTVLFAVITFCYSLKAQVTITNQIDAGGSNSDVFTSMTLTKDSGFIVGGYSKSDISGEKTQTSRGGNDYWVIKYNQQGIKQWDKTIGGNDDDKLYALVQTNDGGYLLGGLSSSNISGEKTKNSRGYSDYWIVKLDSAGNMQWDKTIGGSYIEFLSCIEKTNDGGYLLGGMSLSDVSFEKTEFCRGGYDYWVVKINANGKILWDKTIGGSQYEYLFSVKQTTDNGFIIGGHSYSYISWEKSENSRGLGDYWIVKLDKQHVIEWDKTIGGSENEFLSALLQTPDNGYILCGSSESGISGEKSESTRGYSDYWMVKITKRGIVQWDKTIGGSDIDYAESIQLTKDKGLIIGGYSYSGKSGEKSENMRGLSDYWIVKLNGKGKILWDKTVGGFDYDEPRVIEEIDTDKYLIGGTSSSDSSYDKTQNTRGLEDYWMVNIQSSPGIPNNCLYKTYTDAPLTILPKEDINSIKVYPTVATSVVNVEVKGTTVVSLFDAQGRLITTKTITNKSQFILSRLKPGLYYFKEKNTNSVAKFIIEK